MSKRVSLLGGYTLLMVACEDSDLERVKALLPSPSLNDKNQSGYSALALSVKSGSFEVAKTLIEQGAEVNSINNVRRKAGADTNTADQRGWTPLIIAVYHDYLHCVELLLRYGCNVELRDTVVAMQFGKRAVDRAKSPEMLSLLQRFAAEKRMQKTNVRINTHLMGELPPATPAAGSKPSTKHVASSSQSSGLSRSVSLGRDIHPATVYRSITPKKSPSDKRKEFRDEMERHLQASALSLGSRVGDECQSRLHGLINRELEKVETVLREELDAMFAASAKELFRKSKGFVLTMVDEACKEKGLSLPQTYLHEAEFEAKGSLPNRKTKLKEAGPMRRTYDDLADRHDSGRVQTPSRSISNAAEPLRKEIDDRISTEMQDVAERLEQILSQRLAGELDFKIEQIRESVVKDAGLAMTTVGTEMQRAVENLAKARVAEVVEANRMAGRETENTQKIKPRPAFASPVSKLNLEKVRMNQRRNEDETKVPHSEGEFDSSQVAYQHSFGNSEPGQPLSQDDLRVTSKNAENRPHSGSRPRKTPPKTKVSESLQRFLENERSLS